MEVIAIDRIPGFRIGQAENTAAGTGCTVVICDAGAVAGVDVRGGGPASRETELLSPLTNQVPIHAVVLAGGSAFGLDAGGGVMQYLEEHGIGYEVGVAKVPLVCQADLFDLGVGDVATRPDQQMGYAACVAAENPHFCSGNHGAGTGAMVGKLYGLKYGMKSGIGSHAVKLGELYVGAIAAVNAMGDIFDWKTGKQIAGLRTEDGKHLRSTAECMYGNYETVDNRFLSNTTLGIVLTNGNFNKAQLSKIAGMAHNGFARSIRPMHTSIDGDCIFVMSHGTVDADIDAVGTLAADVMAEAIKDAVLNTESAYGYPCARDLQEKI